MGLGLRRARAMEAQKVKVGVRVRAMEIQKVRVGRVWHVSLKP